jgi:hypothetical protein
MVKFDPKTHHRRSIRLQGYNYSQAGGYFVTIVTWQRQFLFGKIGNYSGQNHLSYCQNDKGQ